MSYSIRVGTAPDSWGVWFPEHPQQVPYPRFLDEAAAAGYTWIELGPYGYLPTDPELLRNELGQRGLKVAAGTVFERLHTDDDWSATWSDVEAVAKLTAAVGGSHVVVIPEMWRDPMTGVAREPRKLTEEQWRRKTDGMNRIGHSLHETFGLRAQYHPHADSHIDTEEHIFRFLDCTNSHDVSLCLDTGHVSYCGGDALNIINKYPERIGYLHLKQIDPYVRSKVKSEDLSFGEAVRLGVMTEPPSGTPELPPILRAVERLGADIFAIVEQDMFGCSPEKPLPIARRTRHYVGSCGARTVQFD